MLEYEIEAERVNAHSGIARCKQAEITIDTDPAGSIDAFNPAELLLAAVAACILKNMERIAPLIRFDYRAVTVRVHGERQDAPPKMARIDYVILVDTDEDEHKLELMHKNIRQYGTIYNTVAAATELSGVLRRAPQG